jgi:hypothetical protein
MKHNVRFTWGWGQDQTGQSAYLIRFEPFILVWDANSFQYLKIKKVELRFFYNIMPVVWLVVY